MQNVSAQRVDQKHVSPRTGQEKLKQNRKRPTPLDCHPRATIAETRIALEVYWGSHGCAWMALDTTQIGYEKTETGRQTRLFEVYH
jgi:hypothetical protein